MRVGILGTGAVGGLYGARLQAAGLEVHFLARSEASTLREEGITLKSPHGNLRLPKILVHASVETFPRCDVLLLAWKTTSNGALSSILPKVVAPNGRVIVLQNGLDPETDVAQWVEPAQVFSGLCFLCARREGPGKIWHQDYGAVTLAAYQPGTAGGKTEGLMQVAELMKKTGEAIQVVDDWRLARWRKLVWNIPFNGLTALLRCNTAEVLAQDDAKELVIRLMRETIAGANRCGVSIAADFADKMLASTLGMVAYEPSMKIDFDLGRPLELNAIYERPLAAILAAGGEAPALEMLLMRLKSEARA